MQALRGGGLPSSDLGLEKWWPAKVISRNCLSLLGQKWYWKLTIATCCSIKRIIMTRGSRRETPWHVTTRHWEWDKQNINSRLAQWINGMLIQCAQLSLYWRAFLSSILDRVNHEASDYPIAVCFRPNFVFSNIRCSVMAHDIVRSLRFHASARQLYLLETLLCESDLDSICTVCGSHKYTRL